MELNPIEICYRRLRDAGREPVKLTVGNPSLQGIAFPPHLLQQAYDTRALSSPYDPDPKGGLEARQAIVANYLSQGYELDPDQILLTSGTSEAFFFLFSLLGEPGDHFLVPYPSYPLFEHLAQYARVSLKPYALLEERDWSWDWDHLARQVDKHTRGIVVISPHNPTGKVLNEQEWEHLTQFAAERDLPLICDEVFSNFYFGEGAFPRGLQHAQTLCFTLNGISKSLALPGHKLGWILVSGPEAKRHGALDALELMADTFLSCNQPVQGALPVLLGQSEDFRRDYFREVSRRRDLALARLAKIPQIKLVSPQGGFYLMASFQDPQGRGEEKWVLDFMEAAGYLVYPGYFFDHASDHHFILSFLTHPDRLEPGLQALERFLAS